MNALLWRVAVTPALLASILFAGRVAGVPALAQVRPALPGLTVSVSVTELSTRLGDTSQFSSTMTNNGDVATGPLIANLNFVAVDGSTFVDPEDWSPERTIEVHSIAAHASATQSWTVKSVTKGDVAAYVVVLPKSAEQSTAGAAAASPAVQIHVEERRALNPGGVVPVVLIVPAVVAVGFAGMRILWRRL